MSLINANLHLKELRSDTVRNKTQQLPSRVVYRETGCQIREMGKQDVMLIKQEPAMKKQNQMIILE